ncbi:MAG: hypothetical protein ACFCD0_20435 [Gemmataceae bacterium]
MRFARTLALVVAVVGGSLVCGEENPKKRRVDVFGEPLPRGAIARLGTTRWLLHESPMLFTSDGKLAVTDARRPCVIDMATGKTVRMLNVTSLGSFLMPDDKTLVVAGIRDSKDVSSFDGLSCFDIHTGKIVRHFRIFGYDFSWSRDGRRVVGCELGGRRLVKVWDLKTGKVLQTWTSPWGQALLSPDGKIVAFRNSKSIKICNVSDGKERCRWKSRSPNVGVSDHCKKFLFSPDAKFVACTETGAVTLWDVTTGKPRRVSKLGSRLETGKESPVTITFSVSGRYLAAGTSSGNLYVWDLRQGKLVQRILDAGHGLPVYVLNFTPDNKTLISQARFFQSARLWDIATGKEMTPPGVNGSPVDAIAFNNDGKQIATHGPGAPLTVWNSRTGKVLHRFSTFGYLGQSNDGPLAFLAKDKLLARGFRHWLSVWDLSSGELLHKTKGKGPFDTTQNNSIQDRVVFPNCSLDENRFLVVFPGQFKPPENPRAHFIHPLRWYRVGVFDLRQGEVVESYRVDLDYLAKIALSPDKRTLVGVNHFSKLVACDWNRRVKLFSLPTFQHPIRRISFSRNGRMLFVLTVENSKTSRKHIIHVYEMASGKKRWKAEFKFDGSSPSLCCVANERLVGFTQGDEVSLFDPRTCEKLAQLKASGGWIRCLEFSPDGKMLGTGSEDTTALVWDVSKVLTPTKTVDLTKKAFDQCWSDLMSQDPRRAYTAIRLLSLAPQKTVGYLNEVMKPVPPMSEKQIRTLVHQLNSERFVIRTRATRKLFILGEAARSVLEAVEKSPPSLECGLRVRKILRKLQKARMQARPLVAEELRVVRAVEVLQRIGTQDAKGLLSQLAKGWEKALLTREAKMALRHNS